MLVFQLKTKVLLSFLAENEKQISSQRQVSPTEHLSFSENGTLTTLTSVEGQNKSSSVQVFPFRLFSLPPFVSLHQKKKK